MSSNIKKKGEEIKAYKYYRNGRISRLVDVQIWYIDDAEEECEGVCILVGRENGDRVSVTINRSILERLLKDKNNK